MSRYALAIQFLICFYLSGVSSAFAEQFLIREGVPHSEIVIAENPPRTTLLAAHELQTYLKKISGADLDIVRGPSLDVPVQIYVGESRYTQQLGITNDDLKHGAYRIVSGKSWVVLIGDDTNFTPIEPWPRGHNDIRSGKMQKSWNQITGHHWGFMNSRLYKHYSGRTALFGTENEQLIDDAGNVNVWNYDERGSFNAVCGFLRDLGVRWYMPGEVGEIVPQLSSIALPEVDKTVRPDFPMRIINFRPGVYGRDVMMWAFHLGLRQPYGRQAAHGLHGMTDNEWTLEHHPEWFALYGGKRHNQLNVSNNQLCYSNEELFQEAVDFARAQLDHFDMDVVSIMPPDGYTAICQCEHCRGKESPELGPRGYLSNYVWDFVNRVAKEVRKTHPDKLISNCAYGVYTEPPSNIEKLEPNVQVIIVGGRRPTSADRDELRRLRSEWQAKTDRPLEIFENYPFTARGYYLPSFIPHVLGESINETKGQSRGEDIWLSMDFKDDAVGFNHFLIYFTARMYWGGKDQDVDAMFDEYVTQFYGPAAPEMAQFFSYCEENWRSMDSNSDTADHALELFATANAAASEGSIYAKRLSYIDLYLNGLRSKAKQLAQKRGPVPKLRLVSGVEQRGEIVLDGKLDDEPWQKIPTASTGWLRELQTGQLATFGTHIKAEWIRNNLYFAIRCEELPGEELNITATRDGDQAIWYGDCVEIEIATDVHSYYQLAISPSGALVDLDRGAPKAQWDSWASNAEVATQIADDHWTVEIKIPITEDLNDPLHQVIGHKPTQSLPWHINVCRQRIRENGSEFSAFSPTGTPAFHIPMKFAHFYAGNSYQFDADPSVTDFLIELRAAEKLTRSRKWEVASAAYQTLASAEGISDYQKSYALKQASQCESALKQYEKATELAGQIPLELLAMTAQMQILTSQREWEQFVSEYSSIDFKSWPFPYIAEAAFARGRAYYFTKQGEQAQADLTLALKYEPDRRIFNSIRLVAGQNLETLLEDIPEALKLYQQIYEGQERIGSADAFRAVDRAAAILALQGDYDQALKQYTVIDFENLTGYWKAEMLLSKARTLQSAGKTDDARELYQEVIEDKSASEAHRERAGEGVQSQK